MLSNAEAVNATPLPLKNRKKREKVKAERKSGDKEKKG